MARYDEMYKEHISVHDIKRLREGIDPQKRWFTDEELKGILAVCSGMVDRAVVKCLLGIEKKAKDKGMADAVVESRNLLRRFEAGLLPI